MLLRVVLVVSLLLTFDCNVIGASKGKCNCKRLQRQLKIVESKYKSKIETLEGRFAEMEKRLNTINIGKFFLKLLFNRIILPFNGLRAKVYVEWQSC